MEEGDAFDLWLRRGLRRAFDAVAAEPVPVDLLRLIEEDHGERDRIREAGRASETRRGLKRSSADTGGS